MRERAPILLFCFLVVSFFIATSNLVYSKSVETPPGSGNWVVNTDTPDPSTAVTATGGTSVVVQVNATVLTGALDHGIFTLGGNYTITNNGTVNATSLFSSGIVALDGNNTITNSNTGTINADSIGIENRGSNSTVTNNGTIHFSSFGIVNTGNNATVTNNGTINATYVKTHGIVNTGNNATVTNNGTINATFYGIASTGINATVTNNGTTLTNTGTINAGEDGIYNTGSNATLTNDGTINADNWGIWDTNYDTTLINSGSINGTAGAIRMGDGDDKVTLLTGSVIYGDIDGGDGTDTINLDGAGAFSDDLLNFEILNKTGAGAWTLDGNADVLTQVTLAGGTLVVNGNLEGTGIIPTVIVNAGATLGGTGTITTGMLTNSGSLAPGNSIGTITIIGDYTHDAGATLLVEVNETTADLVDISGNATINGGTVDVTPVGTIANGATYDILTAAGGYTGTFDDIISHTFLIGFTLDYSDPNTIRLVAAETFTSPNQQGIAGALQAALDAGATGVLADLLLALEPAPDANAINNILDQLSPEVLSDFSEVSFTGIGLFRRAILRRLSSLRPEEQLWSGATGQLYASASNIMTDLGPLVTHAVAPERDESGWSTWVQGYGVYADQNNEDGCFGFDFNILGTAFGIDNKLNDNLVLGLSLGYADADVDFNVVDAETDVDTLYGGLYGSYAADRFYLDAALSYSYNAYESLRHITIGGSTLLADSEHNGDDYAAYLGGGYSFSLDGWNIIPTASLQYIYHYEDSFTESISGSSFMEVSDFDSYSLLSHLGFRLGRIFKMENMKISGELSAQWAHEFADTDRYLTARFAGSPAGLFSVDTIEPDRDSALLGLGITTHLAENFKFYLNYDAELRNNFDAHSFTVGLRIDF